ncbi:hypothetical protein ACW7BC_29860 [Azospirillum argentinense]
MKPEELVSAAELLLAKESPSEGECRAAAHACYYAALHIAAPYVDVNVRDDHDRHKNTRNRMKKGQFVKKPPAQIARLAYYFEDLHRLRITADYDFGVQFGVDEADQALEWMRGALLYSSNS